MKSELFSSDETSCPVNTNFMFILVVYYYLVPCVVKVHKIICSLISYS